MPLKQPSPKPYPASGHDPLPLVLRYMQLCVERRHKRAGDELAHIVAHHTDGLLTAYCGLEDVPRLFTQSSVPLARICGRCVLRAKPYSGITAPCPDRS